MMPPKTEITKADKSCKDRALSNKGWVGGSTFYVKLEKGDKGRGDTKVMFSRKPLH